MSASKEIKMHYNAAEKIASEEVQRLARKILREHPNLHEFIMGMGSAFFTDKYRNVKSSGYEYMAPLFDLIDEWDCVLKITGEPMRFTASGEKVTMW